MITLNKDQLIHELEKSFQGIIDWVNSQPESQFNEELVLGKWPVSGHLYHLIKSTKAVSQGMKIPKMGLQTMFGKNNRPERTYQELLEMYRSNIVDKNIKVPNKYEAEPGRIFEKPKLIQRFKEELNDLIEPLSKWKEEDLSTYVMPHPVMGKLTIREFI